jgi:hypothetical protein
MVGVVAVRVVLVLVVLRLEVLDGRSTLELGKRRRDVPPLLVIVLADVIVVEEVEDCLWGRRSIGLLVN